MKAMHPGKHFSAEGWIHALGMTACLLFTSPTSAHAKTLGELLVELGYRPIKMRQTDNFWHVNVKLNGRSRGAIVDTGSPLCAVDKGIAAKFPRIGTNVVVGLRPLRRELVNIENLELEGTVFTNVPAGVLELSDPWEGHARIGSHIKESSSFELLIGKEFLERSHAILHVAGSTLYLRLESPTARQTNLLAKTLAASGMTNIPLVCVTGPYWIALASFDGHKSGLILDTGVFGTAIDSTSAKAWDITGKNARFNSFGADNRKSSGMVTRVKLLETCGCRLADYPVGVMDLSPWALGAKADADLPVTGLMGNDILARANALFDCHSGSLWVVPKTIKE